MLGRFLDEFTVYAQTANTTTNCGDSGLIKNPINVCTLAEFVDKILNIVVQVGIPVLVISVVYVGFLFVAARGNPEGLTTAKKAMLTVVIGAAIVLGASVISRVISGTIHSLE